MSKKLSVKEQALKNFGHYFDGKTLYATEKFNRKAEQYGTKECGIVDSIMARFPAATISVEKTARKPRLSFEMMEAFICRMPNAEANYEAFIRAKDKASAEKNRFAPVYDWFISTFPFYHTLTETTADGKLVWKGLDEYRKAKEEAATRAETNVRNFPTQTTNDAAETAEAV